MKNSKQIKCRDIIEEILFCTIFKFFWPSSVFNYISNNAHFESTRVIMKGTCFVEWPNRKSFVSVSGLLFAKLTKQLCLFTHRLAWRVKLHRTLSTAQADLFVFYAKGYIHCHPAWLKPYTKMSFIRFVYTVSLLGQLIQQILFPKAEWIRSKLKKLA